MRKIEYERRNWGNKMIGEVYKVSKDKNWKTRLKVKNLDGE